MHYINETKGHMQGAIQEENFSWKAKRYTATLYIKVYEYEKEKFSVGYEQWHARESYHVHEHSMSNVACKRLVRVCFKKVLLKFSAFLIIILRRILISSTPLEWCCLIHVIGLTQKFRSFLFYFSGRIVICVWDAWLVWRSSYSIWWNWCFTHTTGHQF